MTLDQLIADLDTAGVCTLDTGGRISATEARRLACGAGIIPIVLGGRGQVLDVGRRRRLHTEAMRLAMGVRDGGCTAVDCEVPPGLCHAHHDNPWSEGGHTNVKPGDWSVPTTTGGSTTPATRPNTCPTARSASTNANEGRVDQPSTRAGPVVYGLPPAPHPRRQQVETTAPQRSYDRVDQQEHPRRRARDRHDPPRSLSVDRVAAIAPTTTRAPTRSPPRGVRPQARLLGGIGGK